MIDSKGTVATNAALKTEFAQIFLSQPQKLITECLVNVGSAQLEHELKFLFTKECPLS